jgi:hypothetical protein
MNDECKKNLYQTNSGKIIWIAGIGGILFGMFIELSLYIQTNVVSATINIVLILASSFIFGGNYVMLCYRKICITKTHIEIQKPFLNYYKNFLIAEIKEIKQSDYQVKSSSGLLSPSTEIHNGKKTKITFINSRSSLTFDTFENDDYYELIKTIILARNTFINTRKH